MARFEDYVKEAPIDEEIVEAEDQEQVRDDEAGIPERFHGKSRAEIANAYSELEKLNSRQAQDLGSMRKTVDTLLELQSDSGASPQAKRTEEPSAPVTADDLYEKPNESIRRAAREETAGPIKEVKQTIAQLQAQQALAAFDASHPGWRDTANSDGFKSWVREAPYRLRMAQQADQFDLEAADTLLAMYADQQARTQNEDTEAREQKRQRDVGRATLESSGPIPSGQVETFSRSDLLSKRLAAKRGDNQADMYLRVNAEAIRNAYEDGRITD